MQTILDRLPESSADRQSKSEVIAFEPVQSVVVRYMTSISGIIRKLLSADAPTTGIFF